MARNMRKVGQRPALAEVRELVFRSPGTDDDSKTEV